DCRADLLQRHPGVEQLLDDLELDDVGKRVEPLGPRPGSLAQGRLEEAGAGPVVELTIGDPDELADLRGAVAELLRPGGLNVLGRCLGGHVLSSAAAARRITARRGKLRFPFGPLLTAA